MSAVAFVLVLAAQVGPRISAIERLPGLPDSRLDYTAVYGGEFSPLDPSFIDTVLGRLRSTSGTSGFAAGGRPVNAPGSGPGRLIVEHPFTNDDFASAFEVAAVPFTASTDARGAGREPGEPADCSAAGRTVWYRYRAITTRTLVATTTGSQGITSLGVYRGQGLRDVDLLGCDTHTSGHALVGFPAARGEDYFFQVTQQFPGRVVFSLDLAGVTDLASTWPRGRQAPGPSGAGALSRDGRFVAFHSAPNHAPGDTNRCDESVSSVTYGRDNCPDVFIRDRATGTTELISRSSTGAQSNDSSLGPSPSSDGRFVSFTSWATNLVPNDTNRWADIFVRDRVTGRTERVSLSSSGRQGTRATPVVDPGQSSGLNSDVAYDYAIYNLNNLSYISDEGRFVAFASRMNDLVPGDTNSDYDVFLHDRQTRRTVMASVRPDGSPASDDSITLGISGDGRFVAFDSESPDLTVPNDTRRCGQLRCVDIFVYDRLTRRVEKVSRSMSGGEGNDHSLYPSISRDGRYVAYTSLASNLVPGDVEGTEDVFVYDRRTKRTIRASVSSSEQPQFGETEPLTFALPSGDPAFPRPILSDDGSRVAFYSRASNLVPGDTNGAHDVFVRDLRAGTTWRVSVATSGRQGNGDSYNPDLSGDGRTIAFTSQASNLVAHDIPRCTGYDPSTTTSCLDVFTHEVP